MSIQEGGRNKVRGGKEGEGGGEKRGRWGGGKERLGERKVGGDRERDREKVV